MACLISEQEMFDNSKVVALQKGSIIRKKDFLSSSISNNEAFTKYNGIHVSSINDNNKVKATKNICLKVRYECYYLNSAVYVTF